MLYLPSLKDKKGKKSLVTNYLSIKLMHFILVKSGFSINNFLVLIEYDASYKFL